MAVRFRRKNERKSVRKVTSVTCQVVREHDFKLVGESTLDLSPDGMLVPTELDVAPGDVLIVSFQTTDFGIWFDTEAVAARVVHGKRNTDKQKAVGVRFETLDKVKRLILKGHLRKARPPVPARTPRIDYSATVGTLLQTG
jgi:hypothetical protein